MFEYKLPGAVDADVHRFDVPTFLSGDRAVFNAYGAGMLAPGNYFGRNWNAFYDMLMDLQWLSQTTALIYHQDLPQLEDGGLRIYLECLRDAQQEWNAPETDTLAEEHGDFKARSLRVAFSPDLETQVKAALA